MATYNQSVQFDFNGIQLDIELTICKPGGPAHHPWNEVAIGIEEVEAYGNSFDIDGVRLNGISLAEAIENYVIEDIGI